ncbi:TonB-dependent siderophore receptor [Paraburkholderia sp.]|uniref:TonB-dependent siderophore receptor n=1 Tax=Paraburkholderia sp. TaxID=1926495 RepID=UPI0039E2798C
MPSNGHQPAFIQNNPPASAMRRTGPHFRPRVVARAATAIISGAALSAGFSTLSHAQSAPAQQAPAAGKAYSIPAGPLAPALRSLASTANVLLTFTPDQTEGKTTRGISGQYTAEAAFNALLAGTGLAAYQLSNGAWVLKTASPALSDAVVEGGTLPAKAVHAQAVDSSGLPPPYAGGQVASGSHVGILGQKDVMDTPFSTTSYTQVKIQDEQARSVGDVLFANDPSVRTSIGASNRYDAFTIRGLRVANSDVALNGLYGLVPNWRIGTDSLERIELLKGPGAFLYGMAPGGGVGGNVNIITKRADAEPLTEITTDYSSDSVFGGHVDIGRRFGDQKQYGVRLNASMTGGSPPYDGESMRSGDVSLGLDYKGDRFRLSGDFIYQNDRTTAQERGYSVTPGIAVPAAPDPRINLSQPYDFSRSQSTTGLVRGEYDLTDRVTVFAAIGANTFHFDKRETNGGTILDDAGNVNITANALQKGQYDTVTGEVGIRGRFSTGPIDHEATLSANALNQVYKLGQTAFADYMSNIYAPARVSTMATSSYPESKASELTLGSIALADTMSWHHDLVQLTLGGREQHVDSKSYSSTTGLVTRQYNDSVFTPAVGLVIRPVHQFSVYANYIEGLTPGPTPPSTAVNSGDVFAPFKSKQYEAGAKFDFGHIGFGLSAFQIEVPNGITDPTTHIFGLDGQQRNRGIELTTFGTITPRVRVLGGVTFFDARQTHTAGGVTDGRFAIGVPHTQLTLGGEWDVPYVSGLTLTSRVIYTGRTFVDAANQQPVPAWTRLDLGARYAFQAGRIPVVVRGTITNALNHQYWETNPSGYVIGAAPLMAWLSVTADF